MTTMNTKMIQKLMNVILESTDKNVIVKAMTKLRTDLIKDSAGILLFLQVDGLRPMIKFLAKPHEQILEVALSIIANCCTQSLCCEVALNNKIINYLTPILKGITNTLIQNRSCRLLGNLAKHNCDNVVAHQPLIIAQAVCKIIESTQQLDTKVMAFRATRFLLANVKYMKFFLQENGFTILVKNLAVAVTNNDIQVDANGGADEATSKKVGLKMTQHREKYFVETACNLNGYPSHNNEQDLIKAERKFLNSYILPTDKVSLDMISEILRCLLKVSDHQIGFSVWENLIRNGCSLSSLVYFASQDNQYRGTVLRTLSNFSKNLGAFIILSGADAVVAACDLVVSKELKKPLNASERHDCLTLICMLSTDACHRAKIRRSGTLKTLINLIRDSKNEDEKTLILYILNNFQYDNTSLELMLCDGLVPVLVGELQSYLSLEDEYYKKRREEKQSLNKKRKLSPSEVSIAKVMKIDLTQCDQIDIESPCSSPRAMSIASPQSTSSSNAGSLSPRSTCSQMEEEDETYSPVCSDEDDIEEESEKPAAIGQNNVCSEIMKLLDACQPSSVIDENVEDRDNEDEETRGSDSSRRKSETVFITRSSLDIVENLLFHVSLLSHKHDTLGKIETLDTLFQSIEVFGTHNNFTNVLANVLGEKKFLERIIKSGIGHKLLILNKFKDGRIDVSSIIQNLSNVAESNYGKGELERFLRSESEENQKRAAIFVAFVVKTHLTLYHFLNDSNVLTILMNLILSESSTDDLTIEAIESLTTMSQETLNISLPVLDPVMLSSTYGEFCADDAQDFDVNCDMQFIVHSTDTTTTTTSTICGMDSASDSETSPPVCIKFNKALLCNASEVFSTMLNSSFREGTEGVINMTTCSADGLRYFLNLIICQSKNEKFNIPAASHYGLLLEAFEMSRVYIIPELETTLLNLLISVMNEQMCLPVMEWGLKNYHDFLTETAINFYLCSKIEASKKLELFRSAHKSSSSTSWHQLIREAVLVRCRPGVY